MKIITFFVTFSCFLRITIVARYDEILKILIKPLKMPQYLDPKNDLTFKRVFGEHKHLCISLINSMLPLERPVVGIEYQTGELIPEGLT